MAVRNLLEAPKDVDDGVMPLIVSLDASVRELKDDLYHFKREVKDDITNIRLDVAVLGGKVEALNERVDKNLAEYKVIASEIQGEMRTNDARLEGKIDAVNARLDAMQVKMGWYLTAFGLIIALVQFLK